MPDPVARVIAFYLPQFFPIPENDEWWGPGFTEWTNVAKARPLFPGHWQPHIPADLGFYDLRVAETRAAQAALARDCGVQGFAYWHYWFGHGRRILERPFNEVLSTGEPDFPFCLAWANQSWTGKWHGLAHQTLVAQIYPGEEDDVAHFTWCMQAFRDPRYLRVDGRPIFVVYAPYDLPSTPDFVARWRSMAERAGLPGLFLVAVSNVFEQDVDIWRHPVYAPFDAVTPLTPQDYIDHAGRLENRSVSRRLRELDFGSFNRLKAGRFGRPSRIEYADVVDAAFDTMPDERRYIPCVLPNWDNTPRSGVRGVVYENATPALFERYLRKGLHRVVGRPREERIIFLKAWNEWAEGNYVEPDTRWGHAYLDVIRRVVLPSVGAADMREVAGATV